MNLSDFNYNGRIITVNYIVLNALKHYILSRVVFNIFRIMFLVYK